MILAVRHPIIALALLLAGCSGRQGTQFSSPQAAPPARTTDRAVARDTRDRDRSFSTRDAERAARNTRDSDDSISPSDARRARYDLTLDELRAHVRNHSAIIVDARSPEDFSRGHVRGAINVPSGQEEAYIGDLLEHGFDPGQLIIIYCNSAQCPAADKVYDHAAAYGLTNMRVFKPGWQKLSGMHDLQ